MSEQMDNFEIARLLMDEEELPLLHERRKYAEEISNRCKFGHGFLNQTQVVDLITSVIVSENPRSMAVCTKFDTIKLFQNRYGRIKQ